MLKEFIKTEKKKWGLKLCGYLFWNKTIFDNLIILVVKPGWIVHAKYVFFFFLLTQRAYVMMHTNFLQTLLKLLCSIFLLLTSTLTAFINIFWCNLFMTHTSQQAFFFLFPAQYPLHPKGVDLKSAQSDLKGNITSSPDQIGQISILCPLFGCWNSEFWDMITISLSHLTYTPGTSGELAHRLPKTRT